MQKSLVHCRWAPSLGALEDTAENIWGTPPYNWREHLADPCVFLGLYDLRDYLALWRHKGKRYILWCGSDILNLQNGFIFNDGKLKKLSVLFRGHFIKFIYSILKESENWVENETERKTLEALGIPVTGVCPSFLGDVNNFPLSWKPGNNVYLSCSGGRTEEYGFTLVESIAQYVPEVTFHLYGAVWETRHPNVVVHGRVPKEQMNKEIKEFQCALRPNEFDGFSEVIAKAVLMGQNAITKIHYPLIDQYRSTKDLIDMLKNIPLYKTPNITEREYYLTKLNNFPWNAYLQKN